MCYEDIKLGLRRQWKATRVAAAGSLQLPASKQRVGILVSGGVNVATVARLFNGDNPGTAGIGFAVSTTPNFEMWIEKYGSLVQDAWFISASSTSDCTVYEIFDPDLDKPPPAGDPYANMFKADSGYSR